MTGGLAVGPESAPPLARTGLDRAAERRTDPAWLEQAWARAHVLVVSPAGRTLCRSAGDDSEELVFIASSEAPEGLRLFLGVDSDDTPYFAVVAELPTLPAARPVTLREVGAALSDRDTSVFTTAVALANWHAQHRFSPATGAPLQAADAGWLLVDPSGAQVFPRVDPAVIVLVHDGVSGPEGRCLLGRNAAWRGQGGRRFFSTLAGFVEPGESAEAAVVREVREEVGIEVTQLRYQGSQAWPFPSSLMLGFTGYADPTQPVRPAPAEIAEVRWFTRAEVTELLSERPDPAGAPHGAAAPGTVALPGPASIAHYLIRTWLTGR